MVEHPVRSLAPLTLYDYVPYMFTGTYWAIEGANVHGRLTPILHRISTSFLGCLLSYFTIFHLLDEVYLTPWKNIRKYLLLVKWILNSDLVL